MASSLRTSILPERVAAVLSIRSSAPACPEEVERALSSHSFFTRKVVAAPAPRFGRMPTGDEDRSGRFGGFRSAPRAAPTVSEDGFETVGGGGRRRGGGGGGGGAFTDRRHHHSSAPYTSGGAGRTGGGSAAAPAPAPATTSVPAPASASSAVLKDELSFTPISEAPAPAPAFAKFSSAALRAGLDVEDRMLARVKGKINRLGHGTYDATKVFMEQILSSDDTDFLDELMKYIFNKASNESAYCPLYAKLLHELGDEFPHFRTVIHTIFTDYINVFKDVDAGTEPDPSSADYKAFVEAQERKRGRRGYSQFVAELVKLGEADVGTFTTLLHTIASVVEENHNSADKTLMCEEYIDCFSTMCNSASAILRGADWATPLIRRLSVIAAKPKTAATGITNKARFAIMDLADAASSGWRSTTA